MTVTIDTTFGGSAANSYISIADADAYFSSVPHFASVWQALDTAAKTAKLIGACRAIDRLPLRGSRDSLAQALEFPRSPAVLKYRGAEVVTNMTETDTKFAKVKQAQCEMVLFHNFKTDAASGDQTRRLTEVNVSGAVAVKYEDADRGADTGASLSGTMDAIRALLRDWLGGGSSFKWTR